MLNADSVAIVVTKKNTATQDICIVIARNGFSQCATAEFRANVPDDIANKYNPSGNCLRVKCTLYWVKHWVMRIYNLPEDKVSVINAF